MSLARTFLRQRERNFGWKKKMRNKVLFEPLEPRILLSSDLIRTQAPSKAIDLTLRLQKVDDVDTLQLINDVDQSVMESQALANTSAVIIAGAEQSDRLIINFSNPFSIPITFEDTSAGDSDDGAHGHKHG